ncbi:hypothetical protein DAD186_21300 [Dermabacter vaginalis]|uniref:Uncharacterized protein n=1 Tax=Dermabacter vaginalis TaxID=1630135 RepID=A0A1B0ZL50_9MICO|nr:hypothetical protein DAD186_21300 [Dermabacter vaginalis]
MKHTDVNKDVDKWDIRKSSHGGYPHEIDKGTMKVERKPLVEAQKS